MKAIVALLSMLLGTTALAADPKTPPPTPATTGPAGKAPPKVIELEALVIEGKISKPQVFYVLGRSRVEYENLKLQRTFVDRIVSGAKKNPF